MYLGTSQLSTDDGASSGHENGDGEERLYAEHRHRESQAEQNGAAVSHSDSKRGRCSFTLR